VELEAKAGDKSPDWTAAILNPVVGPEAITGSSRMKGGSMTLVLLHVIFARALALLSSAGASLDTDVRTLLYAYQTAYRLAYEPSEALAVAVQTAGDALRFPTGHLYFIGTGNAGLVALMDTTEMVDTYGARLDECRAYLDGGWDTCAATAGLPACLISYFFVC
jgi:N-acetylmuramic acid 6-phosphate (MurNAc-6-P) etherase